MFISTGVILLLVILFLYAKDDISEQISSLRNELGQRNNHDHRSFYNDDFDSGREGTKEKKIEYTFQESQDRQKLGVSYDAGEIEIRKAYSELAKKHRTEIDTKSFREIQLAQKRLIEIESGRKKIEDEKKVKEGLEMKKIVENKEFDDEKSIVFTCGDCGKQNRVERGLGTTSFECSRCKLKGGVST